MLRRLVSASILITVTVLLLILDFRLAQPDSLGRWGVALCLIALFLVSLAASEFISLWKSVDSAAGLSHNSSVPSPKIIGLGSIVMVLVACCAPVAWVPLGLERAPEALSALGTNYPLLFSFSGLLLAFGISVGHEMWCFNPAEERPGAIADRLGRSALIYLYLITLFGFLIPHRWLGNGLGLLAIVAFIATIKMSDSCALFAGKAWGTIKLAPSLSPNKTIQGVMGAYLGSLLAAAIVFFVVAPQIFGIWVDRPGWWFIAYAIAVTTAGILGDLAESMLKRDAQRKDSSSWIPGLGGILDVLDSLVFACPISYLMWMI